MELKYPWDKKKRPELRKCCEELLPGREPLRWIYPWDRGNIEITETMRLTK
jgi:hypothetical protein